MKDGQREIRESYKYFEVSENKSIIFYNFWDTARVVLRGIFITLYYIYLTRMKKLKLIRLLSRKLKERNNLRLKQAE